MGDVSRIPSPQQTPIEVPKPQCHKRAAKMFILDFDLTISVVHVFKQLAGWERANVQFLTPPFAMSEADQVLRVRELYNGPDYIYLPSDEFRKASIIPVHHYDGEKGDSWSTAVLGGKHRVEVLREFFTFLRENNTALCITTRGYVDVVREILRHNNLEKYFFRFYGRHDSMYIRDIKLEPEDYIQGKKRVKWYGKDDIVMELKKEFALDYPEVIFVDDDAMEISLAQPYCRCLFVDQKEGLTPIMMETLKALVFHPVEPMRRPWNPFGDGMMMAH